MQQKTGDAFAVFGLTDKTGNRRRIQRLHINVEPRARMQRMRRQQADQQRKAGDDFEVQQRLATDPADLFHVVHAGDSRDHCAEDDRADDHLDQLDETVTQRLEVDADLRPEMADHNAQRDGDEHLHVEGSQQFLDGHFYYLETVFGHDDPAQASDGLRRKVDSDQYGAAVSAGKPGLRRAAARGLLRRCNGRRAALCRARRWSRVAIP
ncbi:hypothetical protein D3C84_597260 [compost metagenome]